MLRATSIKEMHTTIVLVRLNVKEDRRGNQEWTIQTPIILGTQYTARRQTKEKHNTKNPNKDEKHVPHQQPGMNQCSCDG